MRLIGVGLAAGSGERARPLTLKTATYLRSKAAVRFMGRPVIELQLEALKAGGLRDFVIVAKGRENRFQIKTLVGYGESLGVDIRYSPPMHDHLDRGSADATIRTAEHFNLTDDLLIFPVDSLFDLDVEALWHAHRSRQAALTLVTVPMAGVHTADTYGVVWTAEDGRVVEFLEKPSATVLEARWGPSWPAESVPTNAGFYLVGATLLRHLGHVPGIAHRRLSGLDFGKDLLPWLVREGYPVYTFPARWVGDLGNLAQYLRTMREVLAGHVNLPGLALGPDESPPRRVFTASPVRVGDDWRNVRIGRYCVVGRDCRLENVSVGDECVIGEGVTLVDVHLDDGVMIGDGATVNASVVGLMADIRSEENHRTVVEDLSGIGDEAVVQAGAHLARALVFPRVKVPAGALVTGGTLTAETVRQLVAGEQEVASRATARSRQVSAPGL